MFSIRTSFLFNASKKTWRFSAVFMKNRLLSIHWACFILPWSYEKSGLSFLRFVLINLLKLVPEGIWIAAFFLSVSGKIFLHNVLVIFCVVMWSTWGHVWENASPRKRHSGSGIRTSAAYRHKQPPYLYFSRWPAHPTLSGVALRCHFNCLAPSQWAYTVIHCGFNVARLPHFSTVFCLKIYCSIKQFKGDLWVWILSDMNQQE